MRLKRLELKNVGGVKHFILEPNGKDQSVYGDNGTGKTTIASSISWLMFDKDVMGNTFPIKTLDSSGEPVHHLEHSVEGAFEEEGKTITLKKVFSEIWQTTRGSSEETMNGHTTEHFIDGVPTLQKDYKAKVALIAPEEVFRLLTTPAYFPSIMPWAKRRAMLLDVCGDISDADVVASDKALAPLSSILADRTIEDHKAVLRASMKKTADAIKGIPPRIDELTKTISEESAEAKEKELASARANHAILAESLSAARSGNDGGKAKRVADIDLRLVELEAEFSKKKNAELEEAETTARLARNAVAEVDLKIPVLVAEIEALKKADPLAKIEEAITVSSGQLEALKQEWRDIKAEVFSPGVCPTCSQEIPVGESDIENFNAKRAERIEKNQVAGKAKSQEIQALMAEKESALSQKDKLVEEKQQAIDQLNAVAITLRNSAAKAQAQVDIISNTKIDSKEHVGLAKERHLLSMEIAALDNATDTTELEEKIADLSLEIEGLVDIIARIKLSGETKARIEELKAEDKTLCAEWARMEKELFLMEKFIRTKVSLLEEKINTKFELARFKLFQEQQNGGLAECCEVTFGGVPYGAGLNNGARINVGLDIIRTLSKHFGKDMLTIIDNSESVTTLIPMECQIIRLVVSEADKTLRAV